MKAYVNPELCIGCGLCASIEPDVFRITKAGISEAYSEFDTSIVGNVQQAIDSCPVSAISFENE